MEIAKFIDEKAVNTNDLVAIGCDGTVVNTEKKGVIRKLEYYFNCPLQWHICLLRMPMNCHFDIFFISLMAKLRVHIRLMVRLANYYQI